MFAGKMKAVTFSYDDGVLQDERLIAILDKYGLRGTFNINSELLGKPGELNIQGTRVDHTKIAPERVSTVYRNHEVAVHTLTHPNLTGLSEEEILRQVEEDRKNLSAMVGYSVVGMAYPCGGVNNDDRVAAILKQKASVKYARTITSNHSFDLQKNLYRFDPTVYHREMDAMFALGEEFLRLQPEEPKIFYIWGHSYEFDLWNTWERFEEFCKFISGKADIFYGTNTECLLAY